MKNKKHKWILDFVGGKRNNQTDENKTKDKPNKKNHFTLFI